MRLTRAAVLSATDHRNAGFAFAGRIWPGTASEAEARQRFIGYLQAFRDCDPRGFQALLAIHCPKEE